MRAFGCALYAAFTQTFSLGLLHEIRSYRQDRRIRFERGHGSLARLGVYKLSTNKEIVLLGVSAAYLLSDTVARFPLPPRPFSFRSR